VRFIKKGESPDFFEEEKANVGLTAESSWGEFQNPCKTHLTEHLVREQQGLCAYCECDLSLPITGSESIRSRHLEHLAPQGEHPNLRFSYYNLVASCDGQLLSNQRIKAGESCGHRKANEYDESWFLNPTIEEEISHFFTFDPQDGSIKPADTGRTEHAEKMIKVLNLDAPYLKDARLNAKQVLLEYLATLESEQAQTVLNHELAISREFVSFIRDCFS